MHILRICYDLSTEKLHYTTAMLHYDTLPFLTRTVCVTTYISLNGDSFHTNVIRLIETLTYSVLTVNYYLCVYSTCRAPGF